MGRDEDMARVRFTGDFDYHPTDRTTIAYKAGMTETVKRDCADRAITAGLAVELDAPRSDNAPAPATDDLVEE